MVYPEAVLHLCNLDLGIKVSLIGVVFLNGVLGADQHVLGNHVAAGNADLIPDVVSLGFFYSFKREA